MYKNSVMNEKLLFAQLDKEINIIKVIDEFCFFNFYVHLCWELFEDTQINNIVSCVYW